MSISKVDLAIRAIKYQLEDRKARVDQLQKRMDLNENQKIFIGSELAFIRDFETLLKGYTEGIDKMLGRIPPQATDLESAVLGALMLETKAIHRVQSFLKAMHFYNDANRRVFEAIETLHARNNPIDMRTVVFELRRTGNIEAVGGASYIAELTAKVSAISNLDFHARIIVEMAIKRGLILLGSMLINLGYEDTKDCFELLTLADEQVIELKSWIKK